MNNRSEQLKNLRTTGGTQPDRMGTGPRADVALRDRRHQRPEQRAP